MAREPSLLPYNTEKGERKRKRKENPAMIG